MTEEFGHKKGSTSPILEIVGDQTNNREKKEVIPIYSIRQTEMFSFQQLLEMNTEDKYGHIFVHLNVSPLLLALGKKSWLGRPNQLNFRAMVYSLLIAKMERIEFVKDIVRRLRTCMEFRMQCRFTGSDRIPSESSYSRLIKVLENHGLLERIQDDIVLNAIQEGFLQGTHLAFDSSPVEAWDCQYAESASKRRAQRYKNKNVNTSMEQIELQLKEDKPQPERMKKPVFGRGNTTKAEAERRRVLREAYEATLAPFEQSVEKMVGHSYETLMEAMPQKPALCAKKNSKGKLTTWYGYKANLLIDTDSQYIVSGVLSSANLNDQRMAVALLKSLPQRFPTLHAKHVMADKGYDCNALYQLIRSLKAYPVIDLIHHTEPAQDQDKYFRPLCKQGHAYEYDSFDMKYETLKYTRPKACKECPLVDSGCQKVYKIKLEQDQRKYTYPARGSKGFKELYNKRTAIERIFAYLKEYFGLRRTRHRGTRAKVDFQLSTLAYNLSKFTLNKMNKQIKQCSQIA